MGGAGGCPERRGLSRLGERGPRGTHGAAYGVQWGYGDDGSDGAASVCRCDAGGAHARASDGDGWARDGADGAQRYGAHGHAGGAGGHAQDGHGGARRRGSVWDAGPSARDGASGVRPTVPTAWHARSGEAVPGAGVNAGRLQGRSARAWDGLFEARPRVPKMNRIGWSVYRHGFGRAGALCRNDHGRTSSSLWFERSCAGDGSWITRCAKAIAPRRFGRLRARITTGTKTTRISEVSPWPHLGCA